MDQRLRRSVRRNRVFISRCDAVAGRVSWNPPRELYMPFPGRAWFHVMWHTYGTWLPGDPRGFRDRDHRIHSSGDYKNPPPQGEHEGLHRYAKRVSKSEVVLNTPSLRREVAESLVGVIHGMQCRLLALTVCRVHVHLVVELPEVEDAFRQTLTDIKMESSKRVKGKPASRLWARLWKVVPIDDEAHRQDELIYVRDKQGKSTCTWTFHDGWLRSN
jgi:REP element-mobilizing transposase RayT